MKSFIFFILFFFYVNAIISFDPLVDLRQIFKNSRRGRGGALRDADLTCYDPPLPVSIKPPYPQTLLNALTLLENNITAIVNHYFTSSLRVNIIIDQDIIYDKGWGKMNVTDPNSPIPTADSIYRIASNTKVFTTLQLLQLRDRGLVSLDDPVTKYLPLTIQNQFQSKRGISLYQLAGQISGLPREAPCEINSIGTCNEDTNTIMERLKTQYMILPPGQSPSYSNLGFALLGRALENVTGYTWEQSIPSYIFKPLNMTNSYSYYDINSIGNKLVIGYKGDRMVAPQIDDGWLNPTGGIYTTSNDLAKFISFLFRYDDYKNPNPVLDAVSLRDWFYPGYTYNDGTGMFHPWETITIGNYTLYTKSGGIPGYLSYMGFIPSLKAGFSILQSDYSGTAYQTLSLLGDFLIDVIDPLYQTLYPPPIYPNNVENLYVGRYVGYFAERIYDFNISYIPYGPLQYKNLFLNVLQGSFPDGALDWMGDANSGSGTGDSFYLNTRYLPHSCGDESGGPYEILYFLRSNDGNQIQSLTVPGLYYGLVAEKVA